MSNSIHDKLRGRWLEVYKSYGIEFHGKVSQGWMRIPVPWREDKTPSGALSVETGWIIDRGSGEERMGPIEVIALMSGQDALEVIRSLRKQFNLGPGGAPENSKDDYIARIIGECVPARATTPAAKYIANRLMIDPIDLPNALFHPKMRSNGGKGSFEGEHPAMIHLFKIGKQLTGIHVVYIECDNKGNWGKSTKVESSKKTIGGNFPMSGSSIRVNNNPVGTLHITEGVENAYAAAMMCRLEESVLASGSASLLSSVNVPENFIASRRPVKIWADSDRNFVGIAAGLRLGQRLSQRGVEVEVVADGCIIRPTGRDLLDVYQDKYKD